MTEDNKPRIIFHKSETRGCFNHGWLQTCHTFSFADYRHPDRMGFGLLRVLNDDIVSPERGFGTHSHQNMEIISIPLSGSLSHKDSTGSEEVLRTGDVSGTGNFPFGKKSFQYKCCQFFTNLDFSGFIKMRGYPWGAFQLDRLFEYR